MAVAGTLELQLLADVARLQKDMDRMQSIVSNGARQMQQALDLVGKAFGTVFAGVSAGAFAAWIKSAVDFADSLNDVADASGAAVEKISALQDVAKRNGSGFDTVTQALLKFNQSLQQTAKPGSDAEKMLKAIGLSAKELRDMDPADALHRTAQALAAYADDGMKARSVQELFGKSLREVAPFLKDLAERGELNAKITKQQAEEAEKFNKELFKLRAAADEAGQAIASPLVSWMNELIERFRLGAKEGDSFATTLAKIAGIPIPSPAGLVIAAGRAAMPSTWGSPSNGYSDTKRDLEWWRAQRDSGNSTSIGAAGRDAKILELEAKLASFLNSTAGAGRGIGGYTFPKPTIDNWVTDPEEERRRKKAAEDLKKELEEQQKLLNQLHGLTGSFHEDWNRLSAMYAKGAISLKQLTEAQATLLSQQPAIKKAQEDAEQGQIEHYKARRKAFLDAYDAERKALEELEKATIELRNGQAEQEREALSGILAQAVALEEEVANYGKLRSAVELVKLAKLEETREAMGLAGEDIAAIEARIAAQKRLIAAIKGKEVQDAHRDLWASIDDTARRTWTDVTEHGVSAFERIGKTLKASVLDLLYQMTARRWLIGIAASAGLPGAAAAQQAMGPGPFGQFGGVGTFGGFAGALGTFGAGMSAGVGGLTNGVMGLFGAGNGTTLMGAVDAGFTALGAGNIAGGLGTLAGSLGPIALAAFAIYSLVNKSRGGPKQDGRFGEGFNSLIGRMGNPLEGSVRPVVEAMQAQYATISRAFGGNPDAVRFGLALSTDPQGTSPSFVESAATLNGQQLFASLNRDVGRGDSELQAALDRASKEAVLRALQAAGGSLPQELAAYLASLGDAASLSVETITKALDRLQKAATERQALEEEIYQLTHTDAEKAARARQLELEAVDESNRALMLRVHQLRDEKIAAEAAAAAQQEAAQAVAKAMERARDTVRSYDQFMAGVMGNVRSWLGRMDATPAGGLPAETQLANAALQFQQQLALAQAGNRGALQGITGYADQLLAAQTAVSASGGATAQRMAEIRAALASLPGFQSSEEYLAEVIQNTSDEQVEAIFGAAGSLIGAFDSIDSNLDGLLTFSELQTALGAVASNSTLMHLITRVDANGDGQISRLEAVANNIVALRASVVGKAPDLTLLPGEHFFFAGGGVMTPHGPMPLRMYSGGGIANSPQMAIFGEGSVPEAFVPVPSGRIPVEIRGGGMDPAVLEELRALREQVAALTSVTGAGARGQINVLERVADNTAASSRAARLDAARAPV